LTCDHSFTDFLKIASRCFPGLVLIYRLVRLPQQHRIPHELLRRRKSWKISRAARPWEFLAAVGKRAGLFGYESGRVEAWTYPLKIVRDLRLTILTEGREIPAEDSGANGRPRAPNRRHSFTPAIHHGSRKFFVPVDHRER